ncbi:MAG: hypothetical protein ACE5PV_22780 [Candidatus Poribacteria bacterium]
MKQNILRQNAFTFPIITSDIPEEHQVKSNNDEFAIIGDGHHRKTACQQLNIDVPEFRVNPDELTVKSWGRLFREIQPNNFESIKRQFQLQPNTDCGRGNRRTVIIYLGTHYVFDPNAPIYQNLVKRTLHYEESRGISISESARNRLVEYKLSDLFSKSLSWSQGVFVEDEALNDAQLPECDVFIVTPRFEYKEIVEITYIAGLILVAKATRMILAKSGRPIFLPIPLLFLSDPNLTTLEKTQLLQSALTEVEFEELSDVEKRKLAKIDRPYPEKLYAPLWTSVTRTKWLWRHFRYWIR